MVYIQHAESLTALGDPTESLLGLCAGEVALKRMSIPDIVSEDTVPLAWMTDAFEPEKPRWFGHLARLNAHLPDLPWGSAQYPIYITSSNFGIDRLYALSRETEKTPQPWATPHGLVGELRKAFGWGSKITIYSHACVTGQLGLVQAERSVERGQAEQALVFSFDFLSPFVIGGFHSLKILNEGMPAPYHDGEMGSIGLGEGAGAIVLGKAKTSFKIQSHALFNEMYHFTSNAPDGSGFDALFSEIAKDLGGRKVWVKGHGTGTLEAGRLEAEAVSKLLPGAPLVSWKGSIGHTLGSCAVVELAIAMEAISSGTVPGNLASPAPYFTDAVRAENFSVADYSAALLTSNAFGGAHAGMLLAYE